MTVDTMMTQAGCSNGICAGSCLVACLLTGEATVAFGALGGIIGADVGTPK